MIRSEGNSAARSVHTISRHPLSARDTRRPPDPALNASAKNALINVRNLRLRTYEANNIQENMS
jgi:hypothetical protein